ncbi:MAG: MoxR family ATPase [Lewinellaceae bacterium]|nr:MoxR family ATPase [Lewinellaceae bacterium]MCB9291515.1 MoxR family ATPase [Lewinellaceae bacterium]
MKNFRLYDNTAQRELPRIPRNARLDEPSLYRPSEGLINAVNVALALNQPLLLTGEPGTGKTQLAHHLAWFFQLGEPEVFNAQTTSTARDLFYRYDALSHFQYSQTQKEILSAGEVEEKFITYQALGRAIRDNQRIVVLIDEIDKAPRDLPNDVLAALEALRFYVPETGKAYTADPDNRPVIIMTSNSEKNLPEPFLRRVVYYHIPFPEPETLLDILQLKVEDFPKAGLSAVVEHFDLIRKGRRVKLRKNPATAELIYWAMLLQQLGFPAEKLSDWPSLSREEKEMLAVSYSVLAKNKEDLAELRNMILPSRRGEG